MDKENAPYGRGSALPVSLRQYAGPVLRNTDAAAHQSRAHVQPQHMEGLQVNRFVARYHSEIAATTPGVLDTVTKKFYPRPEYSNIQLGDLARWLNEREQKYPPQL
jgi:hypothetical protein